MVRLVVFLALLMTNGLMADSSPSVLISTQGFTKQELSNTITAYGMIDFSPMGLFNVNFPRSGRISQLHVVAGDRIAKGQSLLEISTDPADRLSYHQDVAAANLAEGELKRMSQLLALKLATQSQHVAAQKTLQDAKAKIHADEQMGGNLAQEIYRAPFDGVVVSLTSYPGDRLTAGATVMQLGDSTHTQAVISVTPEKASLIKPRTPVMLKALFGAAETGESEVVEIRDRVSPDTQMVDVVASTPPIFRPGTRVQAVFILAKEVAWAVPATAVLTDENGPYIFQVAKGKAERVNVTVGISDHQAVQIQGDFDPQKPVVISGNYELEDGMKVREQ